MAFPVFVQNNCFKICKLQFFYVSDFVSGITSKDIFLNIEFLSVKKNMEIRFCIQFILYVSFAIVLLYFKSTFLTGVE